MRYVLLPCLLMFFLSSCSSTQDKPPQPNLPASNHFSFKVTPDNFPVLAFIGGCPIGWEFFNAANDRFLLGSNYPRPVTGGGHEKVEIRREHLPIKATDFRATGSSTQSKLIFKEGKAEDTLGNMPPYYVVSWCKPET